MEGAIVLSKTGTLLVESSAIFSAQQNGFSSSASNTINVYTPPISGAYSGNSSSVQVILTQNSQLFFSKIFLQNSPTFTATSVTSAGQIDNVFLLVTGNIQNALSLTGSSSVSTPDMIYVNSSQSSAVRLTGTSQLQARILNIVGNYTTSGSASINPSTIINTSVTALTDPYLGLAVPAYGVCNQTNYSVGGVTVTTIFPGTYCNGLSIGNSANVIMFPGTYIINRGNFTVNGNARLTGNNVTIILTSSTGSGYGRVNIGGSARTILTAPTTGSLANILFYGDRNSSGLTHNLTGSSVAQTFGGVIYFPSTAVSIAGSSSMVNAPGRCLQLITRSITFSGNSSGIAGCPTNVTSKLKLVE